MEITKKLEDDASDFVTFMYQKGYRGRFLLDRKVPTRMLVGGELSDCLKQLIEKYVASERKSNSLRLETFPPYNDESNSILCQFKVQYDEVKGFLVKEVIIYNERTNDKKTFRLINNHQVPGSQAVLAMYPKPKPWDVMRRGKFRL
jgi:hypothetical protein